MSHRYISILAGGSGERFWPYSRMHRPKHLLPLLGNGSLLEQAMDRVKGLVDPASITVITRKDQHSAFHQVCPDLGADQIIEEPIGRDTAAAAVLATALAASRDDDALVGIFPADHVIENVNAFRTVMESAFALADEQRDSLVTIGIKPTYAATGYGYLQRGEILPESKTVVHRVARFVEKPPLSQAKDYLASGEYFWNGGIFVWSVEAARAALKKHAPEHHALLETLIAGLKSGKPLSQLLSAAYPPLPRISIDYALMEKADDVLMITADFDWDDMGTWSALARHNPINENHNCTRGACAFEDASGNIVVGAKDHLLALVGIHDCIVVHTDDATLICPRSREQDVKKLIDRIEKDPDFQRFTR